MKILRCKSTAIFRRKTKTYAAIYIYALRILLTPKLSRIAPQIPGLRSCQQVVVFLRLRQRAWTFEARKPWCFFFLLWCCRAHKMVLPRLDQLHTFLFIQYDFIAYSTMWSLAVAAEMKVAVSIPRACNESQTSRGSPRQTQSGNTYADFTD